MLFLDSADQLCNRYCGGSHTKITPQQRVARMGNFQKQWGIQVIGLSEKSVSGTDGKIYRGREMTQQELKIIPSKQAILQEKTPSKQVILQEKNPSKQVILLEPSETERTE